MIRVLFVCLGNICRSPTAHGVFTKQVADAGLDGHILVDSAGTSGWHNGVSPDSRSASYAWANGYDLSFIKSRKVCELDFIEQDIILAMDQNNLADLHKVCPAKYVQKLHLFSAFSKLNSVDVPDPYYGGKEGFSKVLTMVELGCNGLLDHIRNRFLEAND